jgi:rhodanese-related sulfurtransferase
MNMLHTACALLLGAASAGALAETPAANRDMPKVLEGITQASGACRKSEPGYTASSAAEPKPDLSCALPAKGVAPLLRRADTVLIDVRGAAEYQAFHIDGALEASLSDVRNKPYWRGKTVVLVGSGKGERELYAACARLKKSHKGMFVLRGGMPAWLTDGHPVQGQAPAPAQMVRLTAPQFWLEGQQEDNLVLLAKEQAALLPDIAMSRVLPQVSAAAIQHVIGQRRTALGNAALGAVVLAAPVDFSDQQLLELQKELAPVPLLVYTGTRDAYRTQMTIQKEIWLAHERGPKQLGCGQ